jgi:hypothetical protein
MQVRLCCGLFAPDATELWRSTVLDSSVAEGGPPAPPAVTLRPPRSRWHHWLEQLPQLIRRQTLHNARNRRLPNEPSGMFSWLTGQ